MLLLGLVLAACSSDGQAEYYEPQHHPQARFLEDLDYLFHILESNCPLLNSAERALGIDVGELMENMRQMTYNRRWTDQMFYANLERHFFQHFRGFGHLSLFDVDWYYMHLWPDTPWGDVLDNPASREFYGSAPAWIGDSGGFDVVRQGNVRTESIEEGRIALITINSFNHGNIEHDGEIVFPFLQSVAGYSHLIIDIRGNGGGSSGYFPIVLMQFLIDAPATYSANFFIMDGEHIGLFHGEQTGFAPVAAEVLAGLPYLHPDDVPLFTYHFHAESTIYPSEDAVGFDGKIWLLVDGRNFSAADFAAVVTRQTGFATIVGEPTGGAGIGWQPIVFALPNTGIAGRFQGVYSTDHLGRNGYEFVTQPDIFNRENMSALTTVLALIEEGGY